MPLQIRRGTEAERQVLAVPPAEGELIWITDDRRLYIGDGTTLSADLTPVTGYNDADARDAAASIFDNGVHSNITFTYDAGNARIDAEVDLSTYDGAISATAYTGSVFADDSTELVNGVDGSINLDGTVKGNIIPDASETYDIGSSGAKFKDIYLSGSSIYLGNATITASGTAVNLPAGSTVGGAPIGPTAMSGNSLNVDIIGDDSSVIVNSATATVTGNFVGDIVGSVFADNSTLLVDAIDGALSTVNLTLRDNYIYSNSQDIYIEHEDISQTARITHYSPEGDTEYKVVGITGGSTSGPGKLYEVSRGTITSPTAIQAGDILTSSTSEAYDGSNVTLSSSYLQQVDPNGTVSAGNVPGQIAFFTFQNGDAATAAGLVINRNGYATINKPLGYDATAALDVEGGAIFTGPVQAASFSGSYGLDNSTIIIDGATGSFNVANVDVVGVATNTPAVGAGDLANVNEWLEVTVNGNTRYIPLYA
jgi:hypothetical protein